jgi:20S proteasome alpha/beta subunit
MTTVVFDGATLAADSQITSSWKTTGQSKFYRFADGSVGAFAGTWADVLRAQLYLDGQTDTEPEGDWSAIIIRPNGTVHAVDDDGCRMDVTGKRYAIGSGAHFALGALACGRGAVEAVRVAIELDPYSGGEIEHVSAATVVPIPAKRGKTTKGTRS